MCVQSVEDVRSNKRIGVFRPIVTGKRRTNICYTEICSFLCSRRPQKVVCSRFLTAIMGQKGKRGLQSFSPPLFAAFHVSSISCLKLKLVSVQFLQVTSDYMSCGCSMYARSPYLFPSFWAYLTTATYHQERFLYECTRKTSFISISILCVSVLRRAPHTTIEKKVNVYCSIYSKKLAAPDVVSAVTAACLPLGKSTIIQCVSCLFVVLGLRCLLDCHVLKGFGIYMIGILDRLY